MKTILLASKSPRRKELLDQLGIPHRIEVREVDETLEGRSLFEGVLHIATKKVKAVAEEYAEETILSADTMVILGEEIMGKPTSKENALQMLQKLNGKSHSVVTGIVLYHQGEYYQEAILTRVTFKNNNEQLLKAYIETGEPLDKAGAYGIQGKGAALVKEIKGSYSNVVGLPLETLYTMLQAVNLQPF